MSTAQTSILQAKSRAWKYANVDGLPTIIEGLTWFLWTGVLTFTVKNHNFPVVLCVVGLFVLIDSRTIIERLRVHITYPRTGYVSPPEPVRPSSSVITLSINREPTLEELEQRRTARNLNLNSETRVQSQSLMSALWRMKDLSFRLLFIPFILGFDGSWICATILSLRGIGSLRDLKNDKLAWVDVLGFVFAGIVIALLSIDHGSRLILLLLTPACLFTLRGILTLLVYLRRNPLPQS